MRIAVCFKFKYSEDLVIQQVVEDFYKLNSDHLVFKRERFEESPP